MKNKTHTFLYILLCTVIVTACQSVPQISLPDIDIKNPFRKETKVVAEVAPAAPLTLGINDILCRMSAGTIQVGKKWRSFKSTDAILPADQPVTISLPASSGAAAREIQGVFDTAGQKITFCPYVDGPPGTQIVCTGCL